MTTKLMKKDEMLPGTVTEAGTTARLNTGFWRTYAPITDYSKCTNCMLCWAYCPDSAIVVKDGKKLGTDFQYCKGCGICATECPVNCIEMKLDGDLTEEEKAGEQPQARD
jgi:pyruvate ferredoxin oxidoreductase delta subunit